MKLIVGLGNPGKKYEKTRHNVGFIAVDRLAKTDSEFPGWKKEKTFKAEIARATFSGQPALLLKPHTFMNLSGEAVQAVAHFYKIKSRDIWVAHDELDFPCGAFRIKIGGSSAGHNGIQSIIDAIGPDFVRFRIGIDWPKPADQPSEEFVIAPFTKPEMDHIKKAIDRFSEAATLALEEGLEAAMTEFNQKKRE